jgi:antirestriction protein ArdC
MSESRYQTMAAELTAKIIAQLEKGDLRWIRGWRSIDAPLNGFTGIPYRGSNVVWLRMAAATIGSEDPRWYTGNQLKAINHHQQMAAIAAAGLDLNDYASLVKYGAKYKSADGIVWASTSPFHFSKFVNFQGVHPAGYVWKWGTYTKQDAETGEEKEGMYAKTFPVFNGAQVHNPEPWQSDLPEPPRIGRIERLRESFPVPTIRGGDSAYYSPGRDIIVMPPLRAFITAQEDAATWLHEAGHATGHPSRCDRDFSGSRGSPKYAREELVGECFSALACQVYNVEHAITNTGAYIASWLSVLHDDKTFIFRAMAEAQKALDWVLQHDPDWHPTGEVGVDATAVEVPEVVTA